MEKAIFTPAVFLTSGIISNDSKQFFNRLADLIFFKLYDKVNLKLSVVFKINYNLLT